MDTTFVTRTEQIHCDTRFYRYRSCRSIGQLPLGRSPMDADVRSPGPTLWQLIRRRWCHHAQRTITPRTAIMPAHTICLTCGWREPVDAISPMATRTWDSTRDEARYEREKKRRAQVELERIQA